MFATIDRKTVLVHDLEADRPAVALPHNSHVPHVDICRDGLHVVSIDANHNVRVWNGVTGKLVVSPLPHHRGVISAVYNPMRRSVITQDTDDTVREWIAPSRTSMSQMLKHAKSITAIAWNSDGSTVVTSSYDGSAALWNAKTGQRTATCNHSAIVVNVAFSPDGKLVATAGSDNTIRLWNAATGEPLTDQILRSGRQLTGIQFSPDSSRLLACGSPLRIWKINSLPPRLVGTFSGGWTTAKFGPAGRQIVACRNTLGKPRALVILDVKTGQEKIKLNELERRVHTTVAFSSQGKLILTSLARKLEVVANKRRKQVRPITSITRMRAGMVIIWNSDTKKEVARIPHADGVRFAAFSPDGTLLVTASDDATARVWESTTGRPVTSILRHYQQLRHAAFCPNGEFVATASDDGTARVWDARTGESVAIFQHPDRVTRVSFAPNGLSLLTACDDGSARIWSLLPDSRPVARLTRLAELLSARRFESGAVVPIKLERLKELTRNFLSKEPQPKRAAK